MVLISIIGHIDLSVCISCINGIYHILKEISSCTSGFTILTCISTHRQFFCTWIVLGRVGKNQAHILVCSPRLHLIKRMLNHTWMITTHLKPGAPFWSSTISGTLWSFFPGETHSQTPFDIHILWLQFWLTHWPSLAAYSLSIQLSLRVSYNS